MREVLTAAEVKINSSSVHQLTAVAWTMVIKKCVCVCVCVCVYTLLLLYNSVNPLIFCRVF